MAPSVRSVEDYIVSKPPIARRRLSELRSLLRQVAPDATEALKWGKPAFISDGILFQYAASKSHISFHPTPSVIDALRDQLCSFALSQNTIRFDLSHPIPETLVRQVAELRLFQHRELGLGWKQS